MILIKNKDHIYGIPASRSVICKPIDKTFRLTSCEKFVDLTTIISASAPIGYLNKDGTAFVPYGSALAIQSNKDKTWFI